MTNSNPSSSDLQQDQLELLSRALDKSNTMDLRSSAFIAEHTSSIGRIRKSCLPNSHHVFDNDGAHYLRFKNSDITKSSLLILLKTENLKSFRRTFFLRKALCAGAISLFLASFCRLNVTAHRHQRRQQRCHKYCKEYHNKYVCRIRELASIRKS